MSKYLDIEEFVRVNTNDISLKPIEIKLPDVPNDKNIIGYHKSTTRQRFERPVIPDIMKNFVRRIQSDMQYPRDATQKKKNFLLRNKIHRELYLHKRRYQAIHDFIDREWERRRNGYWFYNHGVRTYMPGTHYVYCSWWNIDVGVPYYKDVDRRFFVFANMAFNDKNCYGIIEITKRKTGKTYRAGYLNWEKISRTMNARGAIQSKTNDDAEEVYKKAVVYGAQKVPFFFEPLNSGIVNPKTKLEFFSPESEASFLFEQQTDLQSYIDYSPSNKEALDGPKPTFYIGDEEGKTTTVDVYDRWSTVKEGMADDQGNITGKSHHTSTVEEMEKEGGKYYKQLWDESCYHERDPITGQTSSGLWRIFFPAQDGYKIDAYGNSMIAEATDILNAKRKQKRKSGNKGFYAFVRKNPMSVKDCFISGNGTSPFDQDIILKRLEDFYTGNPFLTTGDFEWINGIDDIEHGRVEWIPNKNGRFKVSHLPAVGDRNLKEIRGRRILPGNRMYYVAGGDTFNFNNTEGNDASKGGGAVFRMLDPLVDQHMQDVPKDLKGIEIERYILRHKTHRFTCTYNFRPSSKNVYVEDMIKMCVFYGCEMFPELNFTHIQDGFEDRGFGTYLMHRYDAKKQKIAINPGDSTNDKTKDKLFSYAQQYILEHGSLECHDDFLNQCLSVDFKTMTNYDLFSACAYALYASFELRHKVIRDQMKKQLRESGPQMGTGWFQPNKIIG